MNLSIKNGLLGSALLITLWLTWQTGQNNVPALSEPTRSTSSDTSSQLANSVTSDIGQFKRIARTMIISEVNLFASPVIKSFKKRIVQNKTLVKPAQIAPPLPFKYIGSFKDEVNTKVFIDVAGEVTAVKNGQLINAQYKVINVQKNVIHFLYLPLNQKQTMFIGKTNHE
jgi:hypothetical protein